MSNKIYIVNAGPRKNWNTAQMCASFADGAKSEGAETAEVNLYDLDFKGCRSCFACKLKGGANFGRCSYPDGLTPLLDDIARADGLVIASPVYVLDVTGVAREFLERLLFPFIQYDENHSSGAPKRLRTAVIYTMNITKKFLEEDLLGAMFENAFRNFEFALGGTFTPPVRICAYDTYQFSDYGKYAAELFDERLKAKRRGEEFPKELRAAYDAGAAMARAIKEDVR